MLRRLLLSLVTVGVASTIYADEPNGYYSSCENKNGAALLEALCAKVGPHTDVTYGGLWTLYKTSDVKANGKIWDMYSTKEWTYSTEQCGSSGYTRIGDCYNREHSVPQSWFGKANPMVSDAFHIYPTDGEVNNQRGNYPYGECANGTSVSSYGGVDALGKLGTSTFSGYTGTVFEPDDQYKGDIARGYFYMAAAYNDKIANWSGDVFANNAYPAYADWVVELMLKWHRQDPVSQKELDRQEAVYAAQGNRNPFIDHPEMVEYIWGNKKTENWTNNSAYEPEIALPVNGTTVDLGAVGVGYARDFSIEVKGTALTENANISVVGSGFSVSPTSVAASAVNATEGTTVTVTVNAAAAGNLSGTLTVTSGTAKSVITLTATAYDGLPASSPTNITSESFVAHWTYVGNADANGNYKIVVTYADGSEVDTYPRSVKATDEQCLVNELESETEYKYYITNGTLKSNEITVTTGAPQPSIELLHDGDLYLTAKPGEPSDAEEILVDAENVTGDITLTVDAPFELSSDKATWAQTLTIKANEDRFYIRINGSTEGVYESDIVASSGTYSTDQASVSGKITTHTGFFEDFEKEESNSYDNASVNGTAAVWTLSNAGVFFVDTEAYEGTGYMRMGKNADSYIAMAEDKANGAGTVSLYAAGWSKSDGASSFEVLYSTDSGTNWTSVGSVDIAQPSGSDKVYAPYTFTVNQTGKVRIKIQQTKGSRMCIDNISISDYATTGIEGVESDYRSWDAYCRGGELCVELSTASTVKVYGMDGIAYHNGKLAAGTTTLKLAKGLYVVVVGDFTRRVLVK